MKKTKTENQTDRLFIFIKPSQKKDLVKIAKKTKRSINSIVLEGVDYMMKKLSTD